MQFIEINHFFDDHARLVFTQVIFWDWFADESTYHVHDWRMLTKRNQWPVRDWMRGGVVAIWRDGEVLRIVRARNVLETYTQYDREIYDRALVPVDQRRRLRKP